MYLVFSPVSSQFISTRNGRILVPESPRRDIAAEPSFLIRVGFPCVWITLTFKPLDMCFDHVQSGKPFECDVNVVQRRMVVNQNGACMCPNGCYSIRFAV